VAIQQGIDFLDEMTDPHTGRTGYMRRGELPVRPEGLETRSPGTQSESLTAMAMTVRIFHGTATRDIQLMRAGQELLEKRLPRWDENAGSIDFIYWYFGTLAMFQMGGAAWDRWQASLEAALIAHQEREGSWPPADPWSKEGGRVYSTALAHLRLEVENRYPRVFGQRTK
jgi:hypothetical protein